MSLFLVHPERSEIPLQIIPVSELAYPSLPGSRLRSHCSAALHVFIKELVTEIFTIRYNLFSFSRNQAVESVSHKAGLHSRVMLQGDLHFSVEQIGNIHQEESSVSLIWSEAARCRALFEKDKEYRTLDVYASPTLLDQLSVFFPEMAPLWQNSRSRLLLSPPCFITPAVRNIVQDILDCPYDEQTSPFYFDLKVREYLYVLLAQQAGPRQSPSRFTPYETEQVREAREVLLSGLDKPPLTVRELARRVGLNEFRLKAGFRHFFKTGVFECFQHARMEKARHLLLHTNKPIKDICVQAGYPRMTNFITAFRKHFGYTPASLRRQI